MLFENIGMGLVFAALFGGGAEAAYAKERKAEQEK